MLRIYKKTAEDLIVILLYLREEGFLSDNEGENIFVRIRQYPKYWTDRPNNPIANVFYNLRRKRERHGFVHPPTTILNDLVESCNQDSNKGEIDGNLIDSIIRAVSLPFTRNHAGFGSRDIDRLRKALLLPNEAAALTARLKQKETFCAGCNRQLTNGEIVTFCEEPLTQIRMLYCHRCKRPSLVACDLCDSPADLNKRLAMAHKQPVDCGQHATTTAPQQVDTEQLRENEEMMRGLATRAARDINPVTPAYTPTGDHDPL